MTGVLMQGGGAGLTSSLAELAAGAQARDLGPDVLAAARRAVIDTVGVMLAGRNEAPVALLSRTLRAGGEVTSLATGRQLGAQDAALLDGMAAHVLDYDDVAQHGHLSVVLVPALLAAAQYSGAPGRALLVAYVIGYEAWAELARREPDAYHLGSWHPTPVIGVLAATTALAALEKLDAQTAAHALALAASFASGVIANFGTSAKPLQTARAAAGAIEAVRLARAGLTGSPDAIESPHGLLRGVSPQGRVDTTSTMRLRPGSWRLIEQGLSVKRYPVCYAAHRAIDGVLALRRQAGLEARQVRAVTVELGHAAAATLRYDHPLTGSEARFSLHHNLAAALIDGAVGFAQMNDAFVRRPDAVALYPLTSMTVVKEECPEQPGLAKFDRVVVDTHDGRRLDSGPIRYPRGHARLPLDEAELDAKFLDCALHGNVRDPKRLLAALRGIDKLSNISALAQW